MNNLKVTYTDGTSYVTSANSTPEDFFKYLTQFGREIVTHENDETGKETRKTIAKVEYAWELLEEINGYFFWKYETYSSNYDIYNVTKSPLPPKNLAGYKSYAYLLSVKGLRWHKAANKPA